MDTGRGWFLIRGTATTLPQAGPPRKLKSAKVFWLARCIQKHGTTPAFNGAVMMRLGLIGIALIALAATASGQQPPATKDDVPAEYKPPKGMCRIWLKDVPSKQQPAPTDCAAAVKNVPQNGRVIFGDTEEVKKTK